MNHELQMNLELAKQARKEANAYLRSTRKDVVKDYVYTVVKEAHLTNPMQKAMWAKEPWAARLVALLLGEPIIMGTKMKHGEVNYAKIHALVLEAPLY
jgi:hypothetical protein